LPARAHFTAVESAFLISSSSSLEVVTVSGYIDRGICCESNSILAYTACRSEHGLRAGFIRTDRVDVSPGRTDLSTTTVDVNSRSK